MNIYTLARISIAMAAGLMLVIVLSGCEVATQRATEEAGRAAGEAERPVEDATNVAADAEASAEGDEIPLPEGWPADAPVSAEAIIVSASRESGADHTYYVAVFRVNDTHRDVSAWLRGELQAKGWSIDSESTTGAGGELTTTYSGSKGTLESIINIYAPEAAALWAYEIAADEVLIYHEIWQY